MTTSPSVTLEVKKGNRAARDYVAANGSSQTFNIDDNTKIEVNEERAELTDVQVGDEAKVQVKAARDATTPFTARHLHVEDEDE